MLTVHRLLQERCCGGNWLLTNPISELCLSTVQRAWNVKRWREGNQPLRWPATGLLEAERKFRRIMAIKKSCC